MTWEVKFIPEAVSDLEKMDNSIRKRILKTIPKLEADPHGYGKPLGNKLGLDLSGFYKITPIDGYRMVYLVKDQEVLVLVISVGKREKEKAYRSANDRIKEYYDATKSELALIDELMANMG